MKYVNGFWVMTSAQYDNWMVEYHLILEDPNSSKELLMLAKQFSDQIKIEDF